MPKKEHDELLDRPEVTDAIELINEATGNYYEYRDVIASSDEDALIVSVNHFSFGGIGVNLSFVFEGIDEYDAENSLSIQADFIQKNRSGAELAFSIAPLETIDLDFDKPRKSLKKEKKKIYKYIQKVEGLYFSIENRTDEIMSFVHDCILGFFNKSKAKEGTLFEIHVRENSVDFEVELPNDDFIIAEINQEAGTIYIRKPDGTKEITLNKKNLNELLKIISR